MDDDLRAAIDRLVRGGGRLTIHGGAGASVVLEQPGSRFGILEVRGRLTVPDGEGVGAAGVTFPADWTDPGVTQRRGREVRVHPAESSAGGPRIRARTWRVPPTLAAEIADDVRDVLGQTAGMDFQPLASREPRSAAPAPASPSAAEDAVREDDPRNQRRAAVRTLPAPVRATLALTLVAVIAVFWAGMIRGAPRVPTNQVEPVANPQAGRAPDGTSPTAPDPRASTAHSTPGPFRSHLVDASTEDASGPASAAVDGNPLTAWHAAFGVPQWIEIALDGPSTVQEVVLLIAQPEPGTSRHMIQVAQTGAALQVVGVVDRQIGDGDAIVFRPETPIADVERIRIETLASPSSAGWYEVIVR